MRYYNAHTIKISDVQTTIQTEKRHKMDAESIN